MATPNTTFTTQVLTSAQMNNLPFGVVSREYNTTATLFNNLTTVQSFFTSAAFTPVAGRLYRLTYSIGAVAKLNNIGNLNIQMRKDSIAGTILQESFYSATDLGTYFPFSTSILLTSTQMGTASFVPTVCVQANTAGLSAGNTGGYAGAILFEDIGST